MKLSMWIIANLLESFDPEVHISDNSPRILRSARRFYATDCVYVRQEGDDCIFSWGSDYIRISDLPAWEGAELLQSIFDSMFDWYSQVSVAIARRDYQQLLDQCHVVFKSPMVLQDSNLRCLATSSFYGPGDVDEEWFHLKTHGYSSFNTSRQFSRIFGHRMDSSRLIRYPASSESNICSYITAPIIHNGIPNGSLSVIEKDRLLNYGHTQLLTLLSEMLAPAMSEDNTTADNNSPFLKLLLEGNPISRQTAQQIYAHKHWRADHSYRVLICNFPQNASEEWLHKSFFLSAALSAAFPEDLCGIYENQFVVLANETLLANTLRKERLERYLKEKDMQIAHSLSFPGIEHVPMLFQQARFTLEFGQAYKSDQLFLDFYHDAIDYLIRSAYQPETCLVACHPDVYALYLHDEILYETLSVYLTQDRSVTRTIEKLFIHKNTLLYRLRKIEEFLNHSLLDPYTREYMRLSFRLLERHAGINTL